ncbi:DUF1254 domain-containing protein [Nocardia sp. NPDC050406]|uniref:DUF1254 domain-containing protein n=1 Tax=Nocardia sp. NPDC050406 TaxID=3364318 RepID=UPI003789BABC
MDLPERPVLGWENTMLDAPRRRSLAAVGAALAMLATLMTACADDSDSARSRPSSASDDPLAVATDAYTFGFPLVLMDATRAASTAQVPANHMAVVGPVDPELTTVVMPNVDTLYASAWLDLAREPIVLEVPAMADRYWLMQVMDAWTNTAHDPSSTAPRAAGSNAPYTYAITGPDWSGTLPENMTRLSVPTDTAWLLGRIEYRDNTDLPVAQELQRQLIMAPLGAWERGERPAPTPAPPPAGISPPDRVGQLTGRAFFERLCQLMTTNPPAAADEPALDRFAGIGIEPGGAVDAVSDAVLDAAVAAARESIPAYRNPDARRENGWEFATNLGAYGTDYPLRAATAWDELGANLPRDAVYPALEAAAVDEHGAAMRYRLTFAPGQTPPAAAFWSLTAYTADGYLVHNAANVYSVGHQVPVVAGPDGSVELAMQTQNPGSAVPPGNWLPIPNAGRFRLTLRLYGPAAEALDGRWQPPALIPVG